MNADLAQGAPPLPEEKNYRYLILYPFSRVNSWMKNSKTLLPKMVNILTKRALMHFEEKAA